MLKFYIRIIVCLLLTYLTYDLSAQSFLVTYNFDNANSNSGREDPTPLPAIEGLALGSFKAINSSANPNGLSANPNASGRFSFTGWPKGATNNSDIFSGSMDTQQYYEVTITPAASYTVYLDSIRFVIQRSATGIRQYAVRWSVDGFAANLPAEINPANTFLQVVPNNVFQVSDASAVAQNGSKLSLNPMGINSSVTFRFYGWNAETTAGTFSIDNVSFYGNSVLLANAPVINSSATALQFPSTPVNTTSAAFSYTIKGTNLNSPLNIASPQPFTISISAGGPFVNNLSIPKEEASADHIIYAKFSPVAIGTFTDSIVNSSVGATIVLVGLTGDGTDPANLEFTFDNCNDGGMPGSGFTKYNTLGAQQWVCTKYGLNSSNGININGYSGGAQDNEDWLISPSLQLSALNLPILRFWSRGEFVGPTLQLLVSTNYDGFSDPNLAQWTELDGKFPLLNNTWTLTDGIDLSDYKSFEKVYVAFKYTSSVELGAARWSIDQLDITNRDKLFTLSPSSINFGETKAGTFSSALTLKLKAVGYGDITLTAPSGYQLSADNNSFASQLILPAANTGNSTTIYARFAPLTRQLKIEGTVHFTGTGLDTSQLLLKGTSYPRSETFDAGTYNLSFFGSNPSNNPTPEKIKLQVTNIATVLNKLNLDVVGIEEVSNDQAFDSLIVKLHNSRGILSKRWSYSFNGPDPNFPPQKVGFIYDTTTMKLVEAREMFVGLFDSARNGYASKLPNYPGGASAFWSGGRLPFMATFNAIIDGITQKIIVVDIHAKSSSDANSYNRRVYDIKVLYDSLKVYYSNEPIILVGDYNDRLNGSNYQGQSSPFKNFVDDINSYSALTLPFDLSGKVSYLGGTSMIDHIIVSKDLMKYNIENSTEIEDPRGYISGYNATTASDHLPVYSRFNFSMALPVTLLNFTAENTPEQVHVRWNTVNEMNSAYFAIERSGDDRNFFEIGKVKSTGGSTAISNYLFNDHEPLEGKNYYRLKQVDNNGNYKFSSVVIINRLKKGLLAIAFPNPFTTFVKVTFPGLNQVYQLQVADVNGKVHLSAKGTSSALNTLINQSFKTMPAGIYQLSIWDGNTHQTLKLVKQ